MANRITASAQLVAVARGPDSTWHFAYQFSGRLAYGPLALAWDGRPQLRDLDDHVQDRANEVIIAVPQVLDPDDLRFELRRVPALATARIHIYSLSPADLTSALNLPAPTDDTTSAMPAIEDLRRAVGERLPGVAVDEMEDGVMMALATMVAGVEANRLWCGRFGQTPLDARTLPMAPFPAAIRKLNSHSTSPREPSATRDADRSVGPARSGPPDRFALASAPGNTMLTVADIVALYQVSRSFVYGLTDTIPYTKFGGLRFRKADIEDYLATRTRTPVTNSSRPRPRGMPIALHRLNEVVPGMTREELKKKAGF